MMWGLFSFWIVFGRSLPFSTDQFFERAFYKLKYEMNVISPLVEAQSSDNVIMALLSEYAEVVTFYLPIDFTSSFFL